MIGRRTSPSTTPSPYRLDRRHFLLMGGSTLLLTACRPQAADLSVPAAAPGPLPQSTYTIDDLFSTAPFYIAHRGSGDNWVEHTFDAYENSVRVGAKAIEVSVNATADGVLICHHDRSTKRVTGEDLIVAETDWADIAELQVDARQWLGPAADTQPFALLEDVLDAFAESHVIFIEDKQGSNAVALLDLMDSYPDSTSHFVWKQWAGAGQYRLAADRGYKCWGYFGPELLDRLDALVDRFDYLGILHTASDDEVARVVSYGKPVIAWEIHYRWMRDRMSSLGVVGMMCSNLPYVMLEKPPAQTDRFATGIRADGDLPWTTDQGWGPQPTFHARTDSILLAHQDVQSYLMGSMCPIPSDSYRIQADLCWPQALPDAREHAGIAFGLEDDRAYRVRIAADISGYHVIIRANGLLELYRRAAGVVDGTAIGSVQTSVPEVGEWVRLEVEVTPGTITVYRLDGTGWSFLVRDASYRGGYFWLGKNYTGAPPVAFRTIRTL